MEQAARLHCSLTELQDRLPAWEKPYWQAWRHIKPSGWDADNLNTARIGRWLAQFIGGNKDVDLNSFILPRLTPGAFDPELAEQEEQEREFQKLQSILRDDCGHR